MLRLRRPGLWSHGNFLRLWAGETVSVFGNQIALLAIPLVAVLTLHATATQMGFLTAAERAPWLIVSLAAGVWIDRLRRRPILILADVARGLLFLLIPLAALAHILRMEWLYAIAFVAGVFSVFFNLAYQSYLPSLIGRDQLPDGNGKLEVSSSVSRVAGPSIAGFLVQAITAPLAVFADALSFFVSAIALLRITSIEPTPERRSHEAFWPEMCEGLRYVFGRPLLRAIVLGGGIHNFTNAMLMTVFVLYVTRDLGITPGVLGIIMAVGAVGALGGAIVGRRAGILFGIGPVVILAQAVTAVGGFFYPFATGSGIVSIALLMLGQGIWGFSRPILNINQVSLRQTITPDHLLGRMTASIKFLMTGVMPIGGIVGGVLGTAVGLHTLLIIIVAGELLSAIAFAASPFRYIRDPAEVEPKVGLLKS